MTNKERDEEYLLWLSQFKESPADATAFERGRRAGLAEAAKVCDEMSSARFTAASRAEDLLDEEAIEGTACALGDAAKAVRALAEPGRAGGDS